MSSGAAPPTKKQKTTTTTTATPNSFEFPIDNMDASQDLEFHVPGGSDFCLAIDIKTLKDSFKSFHKIIPHCVIRILPEKKMVAVQAFTESKTAFVRSVIATRGIFTADNQERFIKVDTKKFFSWFKDEDASNFLHLHNLKTRPEKLYGQIISGSANASSSIGQVEFMISQLQVEDSDIQDANNDFAVYSDLYIEFDKQHLQKKVVKSAQDHAASSLKIEVFQGVSPNTGYQHTLVKFRIDDDTMDGGVVTYKNVSEKLDLKPGDLDISFDHIFQKEDQRVIRTYLPRVKETLDPSLLKCVYKHTFNIKDINEFLSQLDVSHIIIKFKPNSPIVIHAQMDEIVSYTSFLTAAKMEEEED